jgi:hypothetical protein
MKSFKEWRELLFGKYFSELLNNVFFIGAIFLPADDAKKVFDHLLEKENWPEIGDNDISPFVNYMRSYWYGKLDKMSCWNDDYPRTTNHAESYHRKLADAFGK